MYSNSVALNLTFSVANYDWTIREKYGHRLSEFRTWCYKRVTWPKKIPMDGRFGVQGGGFTSIFNHYSYDCIAVGLDRGIWSEYSSNHAHPSPLVELGICDCGIQGSLALIVAGIHRFLALAQSSSQRSSVFPKRFSQSILILTVSGIQRVLKICGGRHNLLSVIGTGHDFVGADDRRQRNRECGEGDNPIAILGLFGGFPPAATYPRLRRCFGFISFGSELGDFLFGLLCLQVSYTSRDGNLSDALIGLGLLRAGCLFWHVANLLLIHNTVPQKCILPSPNYRGTVIAIGDTSMENVLSAVVYAGEVVSPI